MITFACVLVVHTTYNFISLPLQGYFQTLFSCIERLLAFLKVKNLVLPAAEEAESIWTEKFGFSKMKPDEVYVYVFLNYLQTRS